ncbi:MAG: histidine phosphotransferase family protein [Asticcacaulis sp.]|uniref:histidine phosphotransferase ChpT n=1 Tax=Asticcacaulis sp. TaxID=1872648 RepID=UPI0039E45B99
MSMDDLSTPNLTRAENTPAAHVDSGSSSAETPAVEAPAAETLDMSPHDLATQLVGKLCHDFISPAGAIMSGLDLLEDPSAQDMKQEALNLIAASAKKMVTLVHFARVAFGAASSSEAFSGAQLEKILGDVFSTMRAELVFAIPGDTLFQKPAARALLNLGLLAGNSLPTGGKATLTVESTDDGLTLTADAAGPRARLKAEAVEGLKGLPLGDGLNGQWIQPHWLWSTVQEARGTLDFTVEPDHLVLTVKLPA